MSAAALNRLNQPPPRFTGRGGGKMRATGGGAVPAASASLDQDRWQTVLAREAFPTFYLQVTYDVDPVTKKENTNAVRSVRLLKGRLADDGSLVRSQTDRGVYWRNEVMQAAYVLLGGEGREGKKAEYGRSFMMVMAVGALPGTLRRRPQIIEQQLEYVQRLDELSEHVRTLMMDVPALRRRVFGKDELKTRAGFVRDLYDEFVGAGHELPPLVSPAGGTGTGKNAKKPTPKDMQQAFSDVVTLNDWYAHGTPAWLEPDALEARLSKAGETLREFREEYRAGWLRRFKKSVGGLVPNPTVDDGEETACERRVKWEAEPSVARFRNVWTTANENPQRHGYPLLKELPDKTKALSDRYVKELQQCCQELTPAEMRKFLEKALPEPPARRKYGRPEVYIGTTRVSGAARPVTFDDEPVPAGSMVQDSGYLYFALGPVDGPTGIGSMSFKMDLGAKLSVYELGEGTTGMRTEEELVGTSMEELAQRMGGGGASASAAAAAAAAAATADGELPQTGVKRSRDEDEHSAASNAAYHDEDAEEDEEDGEAQDAAHVGADEFADE